MDTRQTVLVVEDTMIFMRILTEMLMNTYKVVTASNGKEALKIAKVQTPDIILLDIILPDMDGYKICKVLKSSVLTKDIPIIFITGMNSEKNEEYGLSLGAIDYITKPFSRPIVMARIRNHLKLKKYRDLLQENSMIDALTELSNRRKYDEMIKIEWNRCMRSKKPLSVIMIDIDDFKVYNDTYGHLMGDECLKDIALSLKQELNRTSDFVCRWGGEEFACLIPMSDSNESFLVAEKLRKSVENLMIPNELSSVKKIVTISLGIASKVPRANDDINELINKADEALYFAKRNGKNRVYSYTMENFEEKGK
ncbi:MAG: diguanylate cyclase [Eubacteriaceae bacterium]